MIHTSIQAEVTAGFLVGPLPASWSVHLVHSSPLGLVPKTHSDRWRTIIDLLSPSGKSVNDGIDPAASLDNAVDLVRGLGVGTQLVKMDLRDVYCIVPVHPDDQHLP